MENIYLYIRYSTEKQGDGTSYNRQIDLAKAYCPTLIEDKDHIFFDAGKSAYKGKHLKVGGELKRFYDRVKSGEISAGSTLLVEAMDRLSRQGMWTGFDKLRELTEAGITVYILKENRPYKGELNLSDSITALLAQDLAYKESDRKAGLISDSYRLRYAKARAGEKVKVLLPSWVKWVSTAEYSLKEPEAGIVRDIFAMAVRGWSYAMICKDLNQRGTPTFRGKPGTLWITASVSAIIKGRAVLGEYAPNDGLPPIPDYFPALITEQQFDAAQGARALRKGSGVTTYNQARFNVWSKIAVCTICKRPYHCVPKGGMEHFYLVCSGKFGGRCTAKNIPAKRSEEVFADVLMNVVKSDYFVGNQTKELAEIRALAGQIDTAQVQKQRLDRVLMTNDDLEEVAGAIRKVKSEIARMTAEKQERESKLLERETVERSRASIRAKIDLESRDGRIEANTLLKGLGVIVEIGRDAGGVSYTVYQGEQPTKLLTMHDDGKRVWDKVYSKDVAVRIHELDDTLWPELASERPWGRKKQEAREPSTEPVPNWSTYEEPDWYTVTNEVPDEYTPSEPDPVG